MAYGQFHSALNLLTEGGTKPLQEGMSVDFDNLSIRRGVPKSVKDDEMGFLDDEQQPAVKPQGRMKVKVKNGGQIGTIDSGEFDPEIYEEI